ncbi:MAG TPA: MFS transporter, partial [Novosphingobium sp.]|nr:MFS transporter [Novosphingobium sp.]
AVFGLAMLCANLLFAGILAVLPALDARFGLAGLFAALAGVTFAAWLLLAALMRPGAGRGPAEVGAGVEAGTRARAAFVLAGAGGLFLASVFLSNLGLSMVWTSASRLGVENGLSQSWIAYALALSTLANVAGAGLAAMAALLCGPRPMLLAGLAAGAVAAVLILFAARPQIYVLALCLYGAAYLFIIPFQITMAMHLSPRGHLSAITGGLGLMSYGCGPLAGGVAAAMGAYRLVGVACALLCLCAALAVVLVREPRLQPALG